MGKTVVPMKRKDIKRTVLKFIEENAEYDTQAWAIAFYSKEKGIYSGASRVYSLDTYREKPKQSVYGFVVDFVHHNFFIEGITGRIEESAGNLNTIFGRFHLRYGAKESDTLNKFYILANALGDLSENAQWGGSRESPNSGRGIMRAVTEYPVMEQLTQCKWVKRQHGNYDTVKTMYELVSNLQSKYTASKQTNVRKALGMTASQFKYFCDADNEKIALNYLNIPEDKLSLIDQIHDIAEQVDKERGYHDAKEWADNFYKRFGDYWYNINYKWDYIVNFLMRGKNGKDKPEIINNLVRYLYSSCYHQQALDCEDAVDILRDYYLNVDTDNNPVKYPRYLKTAHDVAAANRYAIKDKKNAVGVYTNYRKHKYLEGTFGNYAVIVAKTPEEIVDEANQQSNCVAGYIGSVAREDDEILFLRKKDKIDESWVTFEIKDDAIIQAYSTYDRPLDEEQSQAIREFAKAFDLKIKYYTIKLINGVRKPDIKPLKGFHKDVDIDADVESEKKFDTKIVSA